ncbi:MAG: carbohydrate ABC transporter permease [Clostridiaceae bacterium]
MKLKRFANVFIYIVMLLLAVIYVFPFIMMVGGSFNKQSIFVPDPLIWIPKEVSLLNYSTIFSQGMVAKWFLNSAIISIVPVITTLLICSAVGYIFAKKKFHGSKTFFWIFMAVLMVPSQLTLIPRYIMYSKFNWIDTFWAFLIPGMWSVMFMFLMKQYISTIPDSLIDAANIDGCGDFIIFFRIIIPLSKSALATVATFTFMNKWNDFMNPLIYTSDSTMYNIVVGFASLLQRTANFGIQMASAVVSFIPIFILFLFFQKYFTEGIVLTGIKG